MIKSCARHKLGYRVMKKFFVLFVVSFCSIATAMSQNYLLDYGPGSIAWSYQMQQRENAISMQNAMMQAQILNYYRQQAAAAAHQLMNNPLQQMQGVVTYDGVYVTPQTVNDYHKETVDCEHCDDGYNYRTIYMGGGESRRIKSRCSFCYGKGTVTKTVRN